MRRTVIGVAIAGALTGAVACRPSDVLSVPPPAGVTAAGAIAGQAGAEAAYGSAKFQFFTASVGDYFSGVLTWSELLTDEFTYAGFSELANDAHMDARRTTSEIAAAAPETGDGPWTALLNARSTLLLAAPGLARYEPASGQSKLGESYALVGYAELLLAEDYCAGTPLDQVTVGGGIQYGMPLTTDSLLGVAASDFDSAQAHANGDPMVTGLASVGLGRALLNKGDYAAAAAAVANVPIDFTYNTELPPTFGDDGIYANNMYAGAYSLSLLRFFNVADGEGQTGLTYRSALDPRLNFDSSLTTQDGGTFYLPTKFETNFAYLPLATGVEAALIQAEAALQANNVAAWAAELNALRTAAPETYLALGAPMDTLPSDSTTSASADERVSVMFRERAFWLFGLGNRLGDLRRLIRQYGRDQSTVFPTGPYPNGHNPNLVVPIPTYGTDVDMTLPTPASGVTVTNPNYKGCLTPTATA